MFFRSSQAPHSATAYAVTHPFGNPAEAPLAKRALIALLNLFFAPIFARVMDQLNALMQAWREGRLPPMPEPAPRTPQAPRTPSAATGRRSHARPAQTRRARIAATATPIRVASHPATPTPTTIPRLTQNTRPSPEIFKKSRQTPLLSHALFVTI